MINITLEHPDKRIRGVDIQSGSTYYCNNTGAILICSGRKLVCIDHTAKSTDVIPGVNYNLRKVDLDITVKFKE